MGTISGQNLFKDNFNFTSDPLKQEKGAYLQITENHLKDP